MGSTLLLYIIILLGIIFFAIYLFRRPKIAINKPLFVLGILIALTGAFLMWNGSILGKNTTGIATVIGIVGIGLIATSGKPKKPQINKSLVKKRILLQNKNMEESMEKNNPRIFIIILLIIGASFCLLGVIDYLAGWNKLGSTIPVSGVVFIVVGYILSFVYKQYKQKSKG